MEACSCSCPQAPQAPQAPQPVRCDLPRPCSCPVSVRDSRTVRMSSWCWRRPGLAILVVLTAVVCTTASGAGGVAGGSAPPGSTPIATGLFAPEDYPYSHHHHRHHNGSRSPAPARSSSGSSRHRHHEDGEQEGGEQQQQQQQRGGCSSCRMREEHHRLSLESIKQQILHKLNLQQAPNITGRRLPIKYEDITELLDAQPRHSPLGYMTGDMQGDDPGAGHFRPGPEVFEEEDDFHAKTERIIAFPQIHSNKVRHRYRGQSVLHFRFSQKVMQNQVAKAVLWLWVRGTGRSPDEDQDPVEDEDEESLAWREPLTVSVMRMKRGNTDAPPPFEAESSAKLSQPDGDGVWVTVDVKKMVEDWFRRPRDNVGLMVHATETADKRQLVNTDTNEDENPKIPFIEVYLTDGRKRRVRRNVGLNCKENSTETRCCRYPLTVDFEKFGWDFIIAPKRYEANYCSGECPYVYQQKYPHTAIMHLVNKDGPCCAPRKMSPINMLYFDSEFNVVYGVLPGMVVDRCGCA